MSTLDRKIPDISGAPQDIETLKRERDEAVKQLRRRERGFSGFATMICAALFGGGLGGVPGAVIGGIAGFVLGINADKQERK